jgi:hypothetical protein
MEQLVILVIIGLIGLVNWLMQRSAEIRERRKEERKRLGIPEGNPFHPSESPAPSPKDPAKEMRRLMEALGVPMEEPEPQFVAPPRIRPAATLPPVFTPPLPKQKSQPQKSPVREPVQPHPTAPLTPAVMKAIRSHDGIRQAIVLREILGPPKALRS